MKTHGLYRGLSFKHYNKTGDFVLWDIELVKRDILNQIFTLKGERVMMPNFGTTIPDMLFEPLTEELILQVEDEIIDVINSDPRVTIEDIDTVADIEINSITCSVFLRYVEIDLTDRLDINLKFEN